jgi:hypothetical protein
MPVCRPACTSARVIFVSAMTVLATGAASAQSTPLPERPREGPGPVVQAAVLDTVQRSLASALDPSLPTIAFEHWLFVTLAHLVEVPRARFADWSVAFCDDRRSNVPGPATELCVEATVPLTAEKHVRVIVAAGALASRPEGTLRWQLQPPELRDVYIERMDGVRAIDSFDVGALGDLAESVRVPFGRWPTTDLTVSISATPLRPAPGQLVRFTVTVKNAGKRAVNRAWASVMIGGSGTGADDIHRDWFPHLAAGESGSFDVVVPVPTGHTIAAVTVRPAHGYKAVRETNPNNNEAVVVVGDPERPSVNARGRGKSGADRRP